MGSAVMFSGETSISDAKLDAWVKDFGDVADLDSVDLAVLEVAVLRLAVTDLPIAGFATVDFAGLGVLADVDFNVDFSVRVVGLRAAWHRATHQLWYAVNRVHQ